MKKDLLCGFRLLKYSDTITSNLLFSILFLSLGLLTLITTKYSPLGATLLVLCPAMISFASISLTMTESIAASPMRRVLELTLPDSFVGFAGIFAYITLTAITIAKTDSSIISYYFTDNIAAYKFYTLGIVAIGFTLIVLPYMHKHLAMLPVSIVAHYLIFKLLSAWFFSDDAIMYGEYDYLENASFIKYYIIGFFVTVICIWVSCKIRLKYYHRSSSPFLVKLAKRRYKKASEGTRYISKKYSFIVSSALIITATVIAFIVFFNALKPDGWYTKDTMKEQYRELLAEKGMVRNETLTFGDYSITLDTQYYDSVTGDGCCQFTIEANEAAVEFYNNSGYSGSGNTCLFYTTDHDTSFSFGRKYDEYYDWYNVAQAIVDGDGVIDIEYEYDKDNDAVLYVYMYMSMMPEIDSDTLSIYFIEERSLYDSYDSEGLYGSIYDDSYSEDIWQSFKLVDTTESRSFVSGDIECAVSRAGIILYDSVEPDSLCIVMEDGSTVPVVEGSAILKGFEKYARKEYVKYSFNELIDIDKVSEVRYEGNDALITYANYISSTETYNMKQTIQAEVIDAENQLINVKIHIEWTDMPEYRNTDFLVIYFDGLSIIGANDTYEPLVIHKVFDSLGKDEANGQWIEAELPENEYVPLSTYTDHSQTPEFSFATVFPNRYDDGFYSLCICPTLYENSSNHTYTRDSITVETVVVLSDMGYKTPNICCVYTHHKDDITGEIEVSDLTASGSSGIVGCRFNQKLYFDELIK